ncbi:DUF4349 domain-containing protein [Lacihabitans sp. LS3-19]|nr:DUF4349 domain-containing protein [Lacihabitans sp. LS3-19]
MFEKTKVLKGYVANESQNKLYDRNEINISLRIPAEHFDDIMNTISETAKSIDERNISVRDVTEDYRDNELRAKNKKEVENRYRELLKRANKVEEILSIEDKLGEIRTEIENSEGHINYLQNRIKYSTLEISFYKKIAESNLSNITFFDSLKKGWKMLIDVLNSLFSFWPFFIILVILYLGIKNYRKKRNSKN